MACICSQLPSIATLTDGRVPEKLTPREGEIVQLVMQGFRNRDIGIALGCSEQTCKNHLRTIFAKLGISDRVSLALYALQMARAQFK